MTSGKNKKKKKKRIALTARTADRHILYEQSVQSVGPTLDFVERIFRKHRKRPCRSIREDFCGTALLSCDWLMRHNDNTAVGVDLDPEPLEWCRQHHLPRLGDDVSRLELYEDNVMTGVGPACDVTAAFNFSYFIFKTRDELRSYFEAAHAKLKDDGALFLDMFGGMSSINECEEPRKIPGFKLADGSRYQGFTYIWHQARFNTITHDTECRIHFEFKDGTKLRNAFRYSWRQWSIPEIRELLTEAGFSVTEAYIHGWDEEGDSDEIFRKRSYYENEEGWIGFIVALK